MIYIFVALRNLNLYLFVCFIFETAEIVSVKFGIGYNKHLKIGSNFILVHICPILTDNK